MATVGTNSKLLRSCLTQVIGVSTHGAASPNLRVQAASEADRPAAPIAMRQPSNLCLGLQFAAEFSATELVSVGVSKHREEKKGDVCEMSVKSRRAARDAVWRHPQTPRLKCLGGP